MDIINILSSFVKWDQIIDWDRVSKEYPVNEDFLERFSNYIRWHKLTENPHLTINLINKYFIKFSLYHLFRHYHNPKELMLHYPNDIQWDDLCANRNVDLSILYNNEKNINWYFLSTNPDLSLDIIRHYSNKINWYHISLNNKNIDYEFINLFNDKINWVALPENKNISYEIRRLYKNKVGFFNSLYNRF